MPAADGVEFPHRQPNPDVLPQPAVLQRGDQDGGRDIAGVVVERHPELDGRVALKDAVAFFAVGDDFRSFITIRGSDADDPGFRFLLLDFLDQGLDAVKRGRDRGRHSFPPSSMTQFRFTFRVRSGVIFFSSSVSSD